jgi:hypothetical protein
LLLLALFAAPAGAQTTIVSHGPDTVSVTVYRDPHRSPDEGIDPEEDWLKGYALVTETRTLDLPPGPVAIRFEGVASGIQPETAITLGLDTLEKNQDRRLLSQRALVDAFTGQSVMVRRTDPATGPVTVEPARIRSGSNGVILETAAGFESLSCTGLKQTLVYPEVPAGVSAKPVLSVTTGDQPGGRRTVTLSYLTGNFDWQANYVGELSPDGASLDLFAWVTLASRDDTSFADAQTNAVAGRVARVERDDDSQDMDSDDEDKFDVVAECWPSPTDAVPPPPPPPPSPGFMNAVPITSVTAEELPNANIVVTAARIARQEALGDLKLYRIPFRVTVAARSQKQVAFLSKPRVKGELLYRSEINSWSDGEDPGLLFRMHNLKAEGLGEPLPAGKVALFQTVGGRRMLLGESDIDDKAVGEEVEFRLPEATNVTVENEDVREADKWLVRRLTVSNANPFPIHYEARFRDDSEGRFDRFGRRLARINGRWVWRVIVPANGKAMLAYRKVKLD